MPDAITPDERQELARLEATIADGIETFWQVGEALLAIRERKLYRHEHQSFGDYCKARWGMSASRARQLSTGWQVWAGLSDANLPQLPTNEAQTRALNAVDEDARPTVWQYALEASERIGKPVTASLIRHAVDVLEEIATTHAITLGEEQITIKDAIVDTIAGEALESYARQRQHIADNAKPVKRWRGQVRRARRLADGRLLVVMVVDGEDIATGEAGLWMREG